MDGVTTTVPPAAEPVSLAEAKAQCRVESAFTDDDAILNRLVKAARELTERHAGRRWVTQTVRLTLAGFPGRAAGLPPGAIVLPVGPAQSVEAVGYYDTAGAWQELDAADYLAGLDLDPPLVCPAPLTCWPQTQSGRPFGAVTVDYVAGYGDAAAAVPELARHAMLLAVGYWYGMRGDDGEPASATGLPPAAVRLLDLLDSGAYP